MLGQNSITAQQTNAEAVREFTQGAGQPTPDTPTAMTDDEVRFITKMILDETMELMATIAPPDIAKDTMKKLINDSEDLPMESYTKSSAYHKIAHQMDALVDIYYYSLNAACKKGANLSS